MSSKAAITAAVEAPKAPICSGSTTCCATTWPRAFISAQDASCDSRMIVEKPVRNSEFCISCTIPERLALTTSSSIASVAIVCLFMRHPQFLPIAHAGDLPGTYERSAIELLQYARPGEPSAHIEPLAPTDRAVEL